MQNTDIKYSKKIEGNKSLSLAEENKLYKLMVDGDLDSRNRLIESQLKWITSLVIKSNNNNTLDLIQMCNEALIEKIHKWDPSKSRLSNFTFLVVRTTISNYFREGFKYEEVSLNDSIIEVENHENGKVYPDFSCAGLDANDLLARIEEKDRNIVSSYYGIDCDQKNLTELGEQYSMSAEGIRKRIEKAIQQMRLYI